MLLGSIRVYFGQWDLRGRNVPKRSEEKERMCWEGEGGAEGMNAAGQRTGDTRHTPGLVGSRARQSRSPVPLRFAQRWAVGIIVESLALRDRTPLDSNRGQCEEKGGERRGEKRRRRKDGYMLVGCTEERFFTW